MNYKEIKKRLKELGYEEFKYFEIKEFTKVNGCPICYITNIDRINDRYCYITLDNQHVLEV